MAGSGPNQLEDNLKRIKDIIISEMPSFLEFTGETFVKTRSKGKRMTYKVLNCSVKAVDLVELGFHGASVMYEAEINLSDSESENLHRVIVKTMPTDAITQTLQNSVDQFFNESKVFSEIIPLLLETCAAPCCEDKKAERPSCNVTAAYELFPKCYYVSHDTENGMIVLQDLRTLGYKIGGSSEMLLDYDHILVALEGLARFHALSYVMKKKDIQKYENHIVSQIRDARRFVKRQTSSDRAESVGYHLFLHYSMKVLLDKFDEKQIGKGEMYVEKIRRIREKMEDFTELFQELLTPEEPLAVLCHGDFNMNNMLFLYDSNSTPCGVKLLDFQTPMYASPAIDLSFFMFLNVSPELWASSWDIFFSAYHQTLLDTLSDFLNCPQEALLPEFSLEAFKDQFSKYSLYGFMIATSFIMGYVYNSSQNAVFDVFGDCVPTVDEFISYAKENVKLVKDEVIDRVLPLTREMLDKISL
jgi:hypothetical protein